MRRFKTLQDEEVRSTKLIIFIFLLPVKSWYVLGRTRRSLNLPLVVQTYSLDFYFLLNEDRNFSVFTKSICLQGILPGGVRWMVQRNQTLDVKDFQNYYEPTGVF